MFFFLVPTNFCELCVDILLCFLNFNSFLEGIFILFFPNNYDLLFQKSGLRDMPTLIGCPLFD